MHVKFLSQELSVCLNNLSKIVPQKPTPAILGNILIDALTDKVVISASDGSIFSTIYLNGEVMQTGQITLPAKLLNDYVNKLSNTEIEIKTSLDLTTVVSSESGEFCLAGIDPEEYPIFEYEAETLKFSIPAQTIFQGLEDTSFAASNELSKQILCGVFMTNCNEEHSLDFAATDSHRLVTSNQELVVNNEEVYPHFSTNIPIKTVTVLRKLIKECQENIEVTIGETLISFKASKFRLISNKILGDYPDYPKLFPGIFNSQFIVNRSEILKSLAKAKIIAVKKSLVKFEVNHSLKVISTTQDVGTYEENINIDSIGENIDIAFNIDYLMKGLENMQSEEVKFLINQDDSPIVIKPLDEAKMDYLIMPVKIV